jgi:hypothetical protein
MAQGCSLRNQMYCAQYSAAGCNLTQPGNDAACWGAAGGDKMYTGARCSWEIGCVIGQGANRLNPGNDEACGGQLGGDRTIVAQDVTGRSGVIWRKVRPDSIRQ